MRLPGVEIASQPDSSITIAPLLVTATVQAPSLVRLSVEADLSLSLSLSSSASFEKEEEEEEEEEDEDEDEDEDGGGDFGGLGGLENRD